MSEMSDVRAPPPRNWGRWLRALRPGFLALAIVACVLGLASARSDGVPLDPALAFASLLLGVLAHAAVNVYNDVADARNGSDAINVDRIAPFTGGSRVIQDGLLSLRQMQWLAGGLAGFVLTGGLALVTLRGSGLVWIGLAGAVIGWAYSSHAVCLMGRGLGELAVAAGWTLVVIGADFVQRGAWSATPVLAGLSLALLAASVLLLNQVPDIKADRASGKRTLAVIIGLRAACRVHAGLMACAYLWLGICVMLERLPPTVLCVLGAVPSGASAWRRFATHVADTRRNLRPALRACVAHTLLHGALLSAGLLLAA